MLIGLRMYLSFITIKRNSYVYGIVNSYLTNFLTRRSQFCKSYCCYMVFNHRGYRYVDITIDNYQYIGNYCYIDSYGDNCQ